jgi:hypothetical protein
MGVVGSAWWIIRFTVGVRKSIYSRTLLGKAAIAGESPLDEIYRSPSLYPKYRGAGGILRESGRTTS